MCALSLAVCSKTSHLLEICGNKKNESRFLFLLNRRRFHSDTRARAHAAFLQLSVKGICIKEGFFLGPREEGVTDLTLFRAHTH